MTNEWCGAPDSVNVFFSFAAEDNTTYRGLVSRWRGELIDQTWSIFGDRSVYIYEYSEERRTTSWERVQNLFIRTGDLFVPFVTGRYLTSDSSKQRYKELHLALERCENDHLDCMPVVLSKIHEGTLEPASRDHWERLRSVANYVPVGDATAFSFYWDACKAEPDATAVPSVFAKHFIDYASEQLEWARNGRVGTRPALRQEAALMNRLNSRTSQDSVLCDLLRQRLPSLSELPTSVRQFSGSADTADPCFDVLLDELALLLECKPEDGVVRSWLQNNLSPPR